MDQRNLFLFTIDLTLIRLCVSETSFRLPTNHLSYAPYVLQLAFGGHKWTRTIDLTLIRRAL